MSRESNALIGLSAGAAYGELVYCGLAVVKLLSMRGCGVGWLLLVDPELLVVAPRFGLGGRLEVE